MRARGIIMQAVDIDIPSREILPENFYSLDTIVALVEKYS